MRKVLVFITSFLLLLTMGSLFQSQAYAECSIDKFQTVEPTPQPITSLPHDFNGEITLRTNSACLPRGTPLKVVAYPSIMLLKDTYFKKLFRQPHRPVESHKERSDDGQTFKANLNFNTEKFDNFYNDGIKGIYAARKPSYIGAWNILICLTEGQAGPIEECDKHPVARGSLNIIQANLLTPTPTPEQDQPVILRSNLQCTFRVDSEIKLIADNILPNEQYNWWWTEDGGSGSVRSGSDTNLQFTIPSNQTGNRKTTDKKPEGYVVCLDIQNKERVGDNCIRFFFKSYDPKTGEGDISCSEKNNAATPPVPESPLPPCSQWLYLNGSPIPTPKLNEQSTYNDPSYKNRKCGAVQTGIGAISTEPQTFVKSIFSIVLGLAGGIALILIIISGYKLMASQGNPEAITAAREQLMSAIIGLLFIIFSFVILQVIGVDILKIPGFSP